MNSAIVFLLVAISGGHSAPATLAVFNDAKVCSLAANMLYQQSKARNGSNYIYAYCIPVLASAVVK